MEEPRDTSLDSVTIGVGLGGLKNLFASRSTRIYFLVIAVYKERGSEDRGLLYN